MYFYEYVYIALVIAVEWPFRDYIYKKRTVR